MAILAELVRRNPFGRKGPDTPNHHPIQVETLADFRQSVLDALARPKSRVNVHAKLVIRSGTIVEEIYGEPHEIPGELFGIQYSLQTRGARPVALDQFYICRPHGGNQSSVDRHKDKAQVLLTADTILRRWEHEFLITTSIEDEFSELGSQRQMVMDDARNNTRIPINTPLTLKR